MENYKTLEPAERVIVALDCGAEEALELAQKLQGQARWFKIGMTLFYAEGPQFVKTIQDMGFKVFVDLKLYDIPFQVQGAVGSLVKAGANMLTLHTSGGVEMLSAAQKAVEDAAADGEAPITLGVTVLTSMDQQTLNEIGIERTPAEHAAILAQCAKDAGISGVVCSPWEAEELRAFLGDNAAIVTPGIRPAGSAADDQKRIATPALAVNMGASHIVVGRPITKAPDPVAAFQAIVAELEEGVA